MRIQIHTCAKYSHSYLTFTQSPLTQWFRRWEAMVTGISHNLNPTKFDTKILLSNRAVSDIRSGGDPIQVDLLALMPAAGFSAPTNVDFHQCHHIQMSPHLSNYIHTKSHNLLVKTRIYDNKKKIIQILGIKGKTITELIQGFTERSIARRTWSGSTFIVEQIFTVDSVLSNPHPNNGVSKVLGILLSDFVSRGSLWRHHGHETKQ